MLAAISTFSCLAKPTQKRPIPPSVTFNAGMPTVDNSGIARFGWKIENAERYSYEIESCQVPESVMYSPEWFVKMKTPTSNSLQFSEAIQETKTKEGDLRIGGGGGNDVPLGRKTMSQGFYNQLRKRYTTSKHGVAKSSRAIAAKTVTESHRAGLDSSWQAIPSTCNATE